MNKNVRLHDLAIKFYSECPPNFSFPLGGNTPIPFAAEFELAQFLLNGKMLTAYELATVRSALTFRQAYYWVIFSVRIAVNSVRISECNLIEASTWGVVIEDGLVDWRDLLVALSIIEDCASRVGVNFQQLLENKIGLGSEKLQKTIRDGYLARSPEMRSTKVMGYVAIDNGSNFGYLKKDN